LGGRPIPLAPSTVRLVSVIFLVLNMSLTLMQFG